MKKITYFIIAISISSICLSAFIYYFSKQGDFTIQDIEGDSSLLQDVSFDTSMVINNYHIPISYTSDKNVQYSLLADSIQITDTYSDFHYFPNEHTKPISDWTITNKENVYFFDDSSLYSRNLNTVDIYFSSSYTEEKANYATSFDIGYIKTDMWYDTTDNIIIKQNNSYNEDEKNYIYHNIEIYNQDEEILSYSNLMKPIYYKGYYYLLPTSNEYMKGQNYIYKAKLLENPISLSYTINEDIKDSFDDPFFNTTIETQKLSKVTMGRNYLTMLMVNEQLYVFSELNHTLYITKYDLDGSYVNEWKYKHQGINNIFQNDSYICWEYQSNLYVLDTKTMKVSKQGEILNTDAVSDLYYDNQKLYVSYFNTNNNNYNYFVQVYKENKLLYHGNMNFSQMKPSPYEELMFYQTSVTFRR